MNILLENDDILNQRLAFQSKQKDYYNRTKCNSKKDKSDEEKERLRNLRNQRAKIYYANNKEKCQSYKINILSKINLYVSALNTGKIKKINHTKLNEYHISFNQDISKYEVETEFAVSFYKNKEKI